MFLLKSLHVLMMCFVDIVAAYLLELIESWPCKDKHSIHLVWLPQHNVLIVV